MSRQNDINVAISEYKDRKAVLTSISFSKSRRRYEITRNCKLVDGVRVCRIRDRRTLDTGGFIEKESNLSQSSNAWVYDEACVFGDAQIKDNAKIKNAARVFGDAIIGGDAVIANNAEVYDFSFIGGDVIIKGQRMIGGLSKMIGSARTFGEDHFEEVMPC